MNSPETLIQRLIAEADLCRNEGAEDIASLLIDSVIALNCLEVRVYGYENSLERLEATREPGT